MILRIVVFFFILEGTRLKHPTVSTITSEVHAGIKFITFVALMTSNHTPKTETVLPNFELVSDILVIEFHDEFASSIGVQLFIFIQDLLLVIS